MSRQQSDQTGEQVETPSDELRQSALENAGEAVGGRRASGRNAQEAQDNPTRVQYGQGFSKDHPSKPGTDPNLSHTAGPDKKRQGATGKRSG